MRIYLRLRLAWLRYWTAALYRRYAFTLVIVVFMFGEALQLVPDWPGRPLLAFARHPADWQTNAIYLLAYMSAAALWARVHREGIRGAALADYVRALPLPARAQQRVDTALLAANLPVLLVPALVAGGYTLASAQPAGADGWFWTYLPAVLLLSAAAGKLTVYGAGLRALILLAVSTLLMLAAPVLTPLMAMAACAGALRILALPRGERRDAPRPQHRMARTPWGALLRAQRDLLLRQEANAFLPRCLWALLPLAFTAWLVQVVGNHRDALFFLHGGLCAALGILAGGYGILARARAAMTVYARSTPHGLRRLLLAEHALMLGLGLLLVTPALLVAAFGAPLYSVGQLAGAALLYLAMLLLFGWPRLTGHAHAVGLKFGLGLAFLFSGLILS